MRSSCEQGLSFLFMNLGGEVEKEEPVDTLDM